MISNALAKLGLGLRTIFGSDRKSRISPYERERKAFEEEVKQQLLKLKKKGINLPVFTL